MNQLTHGRQERHEAGAEPAEQLTGQDGHFDLSAEQLDEKLMVIRAEIDALIAGQFEVLPQDTDLAALRQIRVVFSRLTLTQQLFWLRRFVIRTQYLHAIRTGTTQPQRIEA